MGLTLYKETFAELLKENEEAHPSAQLTSEELKIDRGLKERIEASTQRKLEAARHELAWVCEKKGLLLQNFKQKYPMQKEMHQLTSLTSLKIPQQYCYRKSHFEVFQCWAHRFYIPSISYPSDCPYTPFHHLRVQLIIIDMDAKTKQKIQALHDILDSETPTRDLSEKKKIKVIYILLSCNPITPLLSGY